MAARLTALFTEIEGKLTALREGRGEAKPTFRRGADETAMNDGPPRIVFVRDQGRLTAAEKGKRKNREIATRNPTIQVHLWGKDEDDVEQLLHDVIWILYSSTWGSLELVGERWPDEAATQMGTLVVLSFVVHIPVLEPERRTVKATTFEKDTSDSVQGDGNIDWGES